MAESDGERLANRLARLIRTPTVSQAAGRDERMFEAFRALLAEMYPLTHARLEHERVVGGSLLFHWRGGPGPSTLLMAHYDVVPVSDRNWSRDPFGGAVEAGAVHGRGTLDDKGAVFAILEAVEDLLERGIRPDGDVYLSFGDDEEVAGGHAAAVAELLRRRGVQLELVVDEGGAVVTGVVPMVRGPVAMIGIAEKGILTATVTARAPAGHASAPPKTTATAQLAHALVRLERNPFRARSNPVIAEMLRSLRPRMPWWLAAVVSVRAAESLVVAALNRLGGTVAALTHTTVAVTLLSGSAAANVLADEATATLNIRIAPGETIASTVDRLRALIRGTGVEVEVVDGTEPSPVSPTDGASFGRVRAALAASYPDALPVPYLMVQSSDSRHFVDMGHVYRFMPFPMSAAQLSSIHGADEYVEISGLRSGIMFYQHLIAGAAGH